MLRFKVFDGDEPAGSMNLDGAHLVGADRVPLRTEMKFSDGQIVCNPKTRGAAALSILWPVKGLGRMMLETTRLRERKEPYNLHVELARGQLMRISQKREDWGLYDFQEGEDLYREVDAARDLLVRAITAPDDVAAAREGDAATAASVKAAERMGLFHADVFLKRRFPANLISKRPLGCRVDAERCTEKHVRLLSDAFDFACLPFHWRMLEPKKGKHSTQHLDEALRRLRGCKIPISGCSLVSFDPRHIPAWLPKAASDYETLRERVIKHIKFTLRHFGGHVQAWEAAGGLHAHNPLHLSFEQIMDLTRTATTLVNKEKASPQSRTVVGIVLPWGEYYASNPRTIPPQLYAEMVVQGGVNFDAFGIEILFGAGAPGHYARSLMQVSSLLDQFGGLGRPLHVSAAGVPSGGGHASNGCWHDGWSEAAQAAWVRDFYRIALSKPFVETISWHALADRPGDTTLGGVLREDLSAKPAYEALLAVRRDLLGGSPKKESSKSR